MATLDDYKHKLLVLLPPSDGVFPTELGTHPSWDEWITALARGLADVHDRALEAMAEAFPLEINETLDRWEAMVGLPDESSPDSPTTAERIAAVQAKLSFVADVTKSGLESVARTLRSDPLITIDRRLYPPFMCGVGECGLTPVGFGGSGVWRVNYIENLFDVDPDDFAAWSSPFGVTNNQAYSPVTLAVTAGEIIGDDSHELLGSFDGTYRLGFWVRNPTANLFSIDVDVSDASFSSVAYKSVTPVPGGRWEYVTMEFTVSGESELNFLIDPPDQIYVSYFQFGKVDASFEARMQTFDPIHNYLEFGFR